MTSPIRHIVDRAGTRCVLNAADSGLGADLGRDIGMTAGKKVLVTGADGFIGSHLVEALVKAGCQTRALVVYNSLGSWGWLDRIPAEARAAVEVITGDIRDGQCVDRAANQR